MLMMAEAGLHTFDAKAGCQLRQSLDESGMNDERQRRFIANLYEKPQIGEILLQRCAL